MALIATSSSFEIVKLYTKMDAHKFSYGNALRYTRTSKWIRLNPVRRSQRHYSSIPQICHYLDLYGYWSARYIRCIRSHSNPVSTYKLHRVILSLSNVVATHTLNPKTLRQLKTYLKIDLVS